MEPSDAGGAAALLTFFGEAAAGAGQERGPAPLGAPTAAQAPAALLLRPPAAAAPEWGPPAAAAAPGWGPAAAQLAGAAGGGAPAPARPQARGGGQPPPAAAAAPGLPGGGWDASRAAITLDLRSKDWVIGAGTEWIPWLEVRASADGPSCLRSPAVP